MVQAMKEEMAFLKYRREVVRAWPESPRKTVFLTAIESRISAMQQPPRMVLPVHCTRRRHTGRDGRFQIGTEPVPNQYKPFTSPPSTAIDVPVM